MAAIQYPDPVSLSLEVTPLPRPAPADGTANPNAIRGSCLCGHVVVEACDVPVGVTACHCVQCQKASGSPFLTFGHYHNSALRWTSADPLYRRRPKITLTWHSDQAARGTCTLCGTPLFMKYHAQPDGTSITLGIVDREASAAKLQHIEEHIFLKDKVDWIPLPDDGTIAMHQVNNPSFTKRLKTWRSLGCPVLRDDI